MSDDLAHHVAQLGEVRLHHVGAARGEPALPVHGWPLTRFERRHPIPRLVAGSHDVIAVDL